MNQQPSVVGPIVAAILLYGFFGLCLMVLARKLNENRVWWAWVPVLQVLLMLRLGQVSLWWFIALLVPFINVGVAIYVWIRIAGRRSKPWWMGVLMIVPVADLFVLGYLAYSQ